MLFLLSLSLTLLRTCKIEASYKVSRYCLILITEGRLTIENSLEAIIHENNSLIELDQKYIEYLEILRGYYSMFYQSVPFELILSEDKSYLTLKSLTIAAIIMADKNNSKYISLTLIEVDGELNIVTSNYSVCNNSMLSKKLGRHFKDNLENIHHIQKLY